MKNMSENMNEKSKPYGVLVECINTTGDYCYQVNDSTECEYVSESNNLHNCSYAKHCSAAYNSNHLYDCSMIYHSSYIYKSKDITDSNMIVSCNSLETCSGLIRCNECSDSINCRDSNNLNNCLFCANCSNLSNSMFCFDLKVDGGDAYFLFNQPIPEKTYNRYYSQFAAMKSDIGGYSIMSQNWEIFEAPVIEHRLDKMYSGLTPIFWNWVTCLPGYDPILLYKITLNSELLKT